MRPLLFSIFILGTLAGITQAHAEEDLENALLSTFDQNVRPWSFLDAEQPYIYVGNTPREMALKLPPRKKPLLPKSLLRLAETELPKLASQLGVRGADFEIWPNFDEWGATTWVVARYREDADGPWMWVENRPKNRHRSIKAVVIDTKLTIPEFLNPADPEAADTLFNQSPAGLYDRPEFESVLWVSTGRKQVLAAWLKYGQEEKVKNLCQQNGCVAVCLPPPARLNDTPKSFVVTVKKDGVKFADDIDWEPEHRKRPRKMRLQRRITQWPAGLKANFEEDLKRFTGETAIYSPVTGKKIDFTKQSSAQKDNQLLDVVRYLQKRHQALGFDKEPGFTLEVEDFTWNEIPQHNLIIKIKGSLPPAKNRAIIASGHFDKAVAEDLYEQSLGKTRVTTPGADDNATAVAALLRAAEVFSERYKGNPPAHDIYLLYDTGEEYPAGTLGARYFVSKALLKNGRDIQANINLDMIGHRTKGDVVFQINPGASKDSWNLAELAWNVAKSFGGGWKPEVRYPWSKESYIGQTSATIFDWAGYPTILINEHINLNRKLNPHYHQSTDVAENIDLAYAIVQTKTMIETIAQLAEPR